MSNYVAKQYMVYRNADEIILDEITIENDNAGNPLVKLSVIIDGSTIKNVIFKRDITLKAYAIPPSSGTNLLSAVTLLFGGMVQEVLDRFADYILPPMKHLG